MRIEVPVNGVVIANGVKVKAVPTETCTCQGCYFDNQNSSVCDMLACYYNVREDLIEIIFQKVD
jgi:hypothetical protein